MLATGSGFHPIRIGCSPDPVGHRMKTGWGKADCSTPGDPRRQPHSPPGASPPDPHSGMERAFGPLLSVWGCRHPQACFRGSAPSRLGEKLRPGQLSPRLCAIVSLAKHSLRSVTPCQYWHALGANIGTRPFPRLANIGTWGAMAVPILAPPLPPARLGRHGRRTLRARPPMPDAGFTAGIMCFYRTSPPHPHPLRRQVGLAEQV
jgi:hypothetical protein